MKRFVNILIVMFLMLASSTNLYADDQCDSLLVTMKDGHCYQFVFDNSMKLSFAKDSMYINSQDISFGVDSIAKIHFVKTGDPGGTSPIHEVKNTVTTVDISYLSRNTIRITGLDSPQEPRVYSIKGSQMPFDVDRNDNDLIIHLQQYPSGTYIIKVGKHSFKIMVK